MGTKPIKEIVPEPPDVPETDALNKVVGDAILDGSELEAVRLVGINQYPIHAKRVLIENSRIEGPALVGSKLPGVRMLDCVLERADLAGATWTDARIVRGQFNECRLTGFDARHSELRDVVFVECKMLGALLSEASLTRVRFEKCQLAELDLSGAKIHSVAIQECDTRSMNLLGAKIELLDLRGSLIEGITLDPAFIKGIVIDPMQGDALAQALGVRVVDIDP